MAKIIFFSGAGISAESGISTFRDSDGLWEQYKIEDVCTAGCLEKNRKMTLKFYDSRRIELKDKEPNKAHIKIAELKNKYPNEIAVITQNVDDLFEKVGCKDVIHLHGFLTQLCCMRSGCEYVEEIGYVSQDDQRRCPKCNEAMRPNIVFFYEPAPMYRKLEEELRDCKMLIIIGTSGNVIDVQRLLGPSVRMSILNNLEESMVINDELFSKVLYKKATEAIDEIVKDTEAYIARISR